MKRTYFNEKQIDLLKEIWILIKKIACDIKEAQRAARSVAQGGMRVFSAWNPGLDAKKTWSPEGTTQRTRLSMPTGWVKTAAITQQPASRLLIFSSRFVRVGGCVRR